MHNEIEDVTHIIEELEGVVEERIIAKTKFEQEMKILRGLGCESTNESGKEIKKLDGKIETRGEALSEEFSDFMEDYEEIFK